MANEIKGGLGHDDQMPAAARAGRRPGRPATREQILSAARDLFAELGYDRATIRAIAERAGVDSRLVTHYFGSKQRLFVAAAEPPVDPESVLPTLLRESDDPAVAMAHFIAALLDDPGYQRLATGLIRAAASEPEAAELAREFLTDRVLEPVARILDADQPDVRAALVGSQIVGLLFARNIIRIPALAALDSDQLASVLAPVVQRYLLDPLAPR